MEGHDMDSRISRIEDAVYDTRGAVIRIEANQTFFSGAMR